MHPSSLDPHNHVLPEEVTQLSPLAAQGQFQAPVQRAVLSEPRLVRAAGGQIVGLSVFPTGQQVL